MEETQTFLTKAFIVAIFLIALVLISEFNSVSQPVIILTSVILSLAGVFLGLLADDYRDFRMDRESEKEYLQLLAEDLTIPRATEGAGYARVHAASTVTIRLRKLLQRA